MLIYGYFCIKLKIQTFAVTTLQYELQLTINSIMPSETTPVRNEINIKQQQSNTKTKKMKHLTTSPERDHMFRLRNDTASLTSVLHCRR